MKRLLTVLGSIGLFGSQLAPLAGMISPKASVIATAASGIALMLGKSILEFRAAPGASTDVPGSDRVQ